MFRYLTAAPDTQRHGCVNGTAAECVDKMLMYILDYKSKLKIMTKLHTRHKFAIYKVDVKAMAALYPDNF